MRTPAARRRNRHFAKERTCAIDGHHCFDMKRLICTAALFASITVSHATLVVGSWTPIFKGVDHAVGTNFSPLQVVQCVRVDLTDPGVQLFATPRASGYFAESR